jgi:hypothetical protein
MELGKQRWRTWLGFLFFSVLQLSFLFERIYIGFTFRPCLNVFTSDSHFAPVWMYFHRIHISPLIECIYIGFTFGPCLNVFTSDSHLAPVWMYLHRIHISPLFECIYIEFTLHICLSAFKSDSHFISVCMYLHRSVYKRMTQPITFASCLNAFTSGYVLFLFKCIYIGLRFVPVSMHLQRE